MAHFTAQNSEFTQSQRDELNAAYDRLILDRVDADTTDEDRQDADKAITDSLNNAWVEGITSNELVALVRGGWA